MSPQQECLRFERIPVLRALLVGACVLQTIVGCYTGTLNATRTLTKTEVGKVAVLWFSGFQGTQFADLIAHELLSAGIEVVERQRLLAILAEQGIGEAQLESRGADIRRIGEILGARTLVVGSISPIYVYASGSPTSKVSSASMRLLNVNDGTILSSVAFNNNSDLLGPAPTYGDVATRIVLTLLGKSN